MAAGERRKVELVTPTAHRTIFQSIKHQNTVNNSPIWILSSFFFSSKFKRLHPLNIRNHFKQPA